MSLTGNPEAPIDLKNPSQYIDEFCQHQQEVEAHLRGRLTGSSPLHPTYFPPASYWTSAEKDLFFHGLTIYSRFRPDLIAEHIKTKDMFDVCIYLDSLQMAASQEVEDMIGTDNRNMTDPAMEVSEKWVAHEESMVANLNTFGSCPWTLGNEKRYKTGSQAPCSCFDDTSSNIPQDHHTTNPGARRGGREYLAHLDLGSMMAVDSIFRERECDPEVQNFSDSGDNQQTAITTEPGVERIATNGHGSSAVETAINSVHPDQRTVLDDQESPSEPETITAKVDNGLEDHLNEQEREAQRRLQKRLYMRRKRAERAGKAVVAEAIKLRPGRQKRDRKPSKPRPKVYNTSKKTNQKHSGTISPEPEMSSSSERSNSVEKDKEDIEYEARSQSGLTKSYRVKKIFQENGISAEMLSNMGLDFFHLTTLSRLLRLFNSFDSSTTPVETLSISADTVQLLANILVRFISEIMRRAIITKEQEIRLKRSLKVWKYDKDEITAENLMECLKTMGLDHLNKENYFARALSQSRSDSTDSVVSSTSNENTNNSPEGQDQLAQTSRFTLPESMMWCSLPSYRDIFSNDGPIPSEMNQNELQMELSEEKKFSIKDKSGSRKYEESLWNELIMAG